MVAFKVASLISDIYLIRYMATCRKPIILSTGMATYSDIQAALKVCRAEGNMEIILLQCTSLYPAPAYLSNLAAMETMRKAFNCPVGYSDHTLGDHIPLAAVALGACMIEKHFTLDRKLPGPDHSFAMEPYTKRNDSQYLSLKLRLVMGLKMVHIKKKWKCMRRADAVFIQ
jgi:sialic acid synthase SpsE